MEAPHSKPVVKAKVKDTSSTESEASQPLTIVRNTHNQIRATAMINSAVVGQFAISCSYVATTIIIIASNII